jgi:hypothetical protein
MFLRSFGRESFAVSGPLALTGAPHIRRALSADEERASCSSARKFTTRFFQRRPRGRTGVPACHLAVRVGRCDQLPFGLSPLSTSMLGTQQKRPRSRLRSLFPLGRERLTLPGFEPDTWSLRHLPHGSNAYRQLRVSDGDGFGTSPPHTVPFRVKPQLHGTRTEQEQRKGTKTGRQSPRESLQIGTTRRSLDLL